MEKERIALSQRERDRLRVCLVTMSARRHVNPKPQMEACGQEFFAAPAVRWCISIPTRAVKTKIPA